MELVAPPVLVRDQRSALGHTVAYAVAELDILEHLLHFAVERSTADDQVTQLAAKRLHERLVDFLADDQADTRRMPQHFHQRLVDHRQHFLLDDLLDHQRHGQDHERMNLGKRLHQRRRGRCTGQEVRLGTLAALVEELVHQSEHVRYRQHRQLRVTRTVRNTVSRKIHVTRQVKVSQHNALGRTC